MSATVPTDRRAESLRALFTDLGYTEDLVAWNFPVWTNGSVELADLVGFGTPHPHDMTTATIVGGLAFGLELLAPRQLELARALATPVGVVAAPEHMQVWTVTTRGDDARVLADIAYEGLDPTQGRLRAELAPDVLLAAKRTARQLSLFPMDASLLAHARQHTATRLSARVEDALASMRAAHPALSLELASRCVLAAAGALMVHDKLTGFTAARSEVLAFAIAHYPGSFGWLEEVDPVTLEALEYVVQLLGDSINYASVDPTIVSEVYENALVDRETRERLGIHYTPFELARQLARYIPFEELEPDRRAVLDPSCGSGTLLLAAQDRMAAAAPGALARAERHEYVRSHLRGLDADPFATEIARLALLLNGLPEGDSWRIDVWDTLQGNPPEMQQKPTVVLSNPPWKGTRSKAGKRDELADHFLRHMLDVVAPEGFLTAILPVTWLSSDTSQQSRELLLEQAAVYEVWRLPEDTFGSSAMAPCVLFAQKHAQTSRFVFRRALQRRGWKERFFVEEDPDEVYLSDLDQGVDPTVLLRGPLDAHVAELQALRPLTEIADVLSGPVPRPRHTPSGDGPYKFLRSAAAVPAFGAIDESVLEQVEFPGDFHRSSADPAPYLVPKLLVSAKRSADNPWRLVVRHDPIGVIYRETLSGVRPKSGDADELHALAAVLSSSFASCWIDALDAKMSFSIRLLRQLPIPEPGEAWADLAAIGRELLEAGGRQEFHPELFERLELAVVNAYELPAEVTEGLAAHFADVVAPEGRPRFSSLGPRRISLEPTQRRFGSVLAVGANAVCLWVQGVTQDSGEWLPMPRRLPGWLCSPGATFDVEIRGRDLLDARYSFQSRSFLELDDLLPREAAS